MVSMGILITHLTKPLTFWKLMFNYNLDSVMSIGVIMFQVYTAILFVWLAIIFYEPLEDFILNFWGGKLRGLHGLFQWAMNLIRRFEISIELVLGIIAVALGVYTGFLLSALKTYPMLDNPWLPVLFLFSGISSGVAGTLLLGVTLFKEEPSGPAVHWMHTIEKPLIFGELLILGVFFGWLILDGGRSEVAALAAIAGGFWAMVFWVGVVGLGLLTPLALQTITPHGIQHSTGFVVVLTSCSLLGVVALRYFVLYAGQMTVF
jgi:protein NrfD